jgi:hypothetical protein
MLQIQTSTNGDDLITGILLLEASFNQEYAMTYYAKKEAEFIIDKARKAPIPFKTGDLSRSAKIVDTASGEVTFGFTVEYAAIQDQGSRDGITLPPKRFGSKKGPNFYLSGTIRKELPKALARIGQKMRNDIKKTLGANKAMKRLNR